MQYTILIRKAPDGFYIASCPLIPEAQAQGETYEECVANIKEVLELLHTFCAKIFQKGAKDAVYIHYLIARLKKAYPESKLNLTPLVIVKTKGGK